MARPCRYARNLACVGGLLMIGACAGTAGTGASSPNVDPRERLVDAQSRLKVNPDDVKALFDLGLAWQESATWGPTVIPAYHDSASAAFKAVLEQEPENVRALVHHGLALEDRNKPEAALEAYRKAVELAPDDALPQINLGSLLYFHFRKTYEAKVALTRALEIDPDNADAHFNLGVLFADVNLYGEALREWERVVELDGDGPAGKLATENLDRIRPILEAQESDEDVEE